MSTKNLESIDSARKSKKQRERERRARARGIYIRRSVVDHIAATIAETRATRGRRLIVNPHWNYAPGERNG